MKKSYKPVSCGFEVRAMSPLGEYPDRSIILDDAALIVTPDLCFSMMRVEDEDWSFSEVDSLSALEIPFLGALLLSRAGTPYPAHLLTLEAGEHVPIDPECTQECRKHLLGSLEEQRSLNWPAAIIHRPPAIRGIPYNLLDCGKCIRYEECIHKVTEHFTNLRTAGPVVNRGVASLLKAQMAWRHGEFADAACIYLWIALDAAYSLTLQKLRERGVINPTAKHASEYFNGIVGYETPWEKFFEEDYENRIRAIHPDNRFGAEARPQFLADDYLELNDILVPYFAFLVSGTTVEVRRP